MTDQGVVTQVRTQPGNIVIAPDERNLGLLSQIVDDPIAAQARDPSSRRR